MNKLYAKFVAIILFAFAVSGCKLDAPVYQEGMVSTIGKDKGDGTGPGTNTGDAFYPLGANNTVVVKMDGQTYTYDLYASYELTTDEVSPLGRTTILAMSKNSALLFTLMFDSTTAGTHEVDVLGFDSYSSINKTGESTGTVKASVITNHKLQGSFKLNVADNMGIEHKDVVGSFNISK